MLMSRFALAALASVLFLAPATSAQEFGRVDQIQNTSQGYFYHVIPGEATIKVYVWGTVRMPGTYEVSATADLGDVLSLAGGPQLTPLRQSDVLDVEREITIRVYRLDGQQRVLLYDHTLEEMVAATEVYPTLQEGDVVEVQTAETETRRWTWRETLTIVGAVATTVIATSQLIGVVR